MQLTTLVLTLLQKPTGTLKFIHRRPFGKGEHFIVFHAGVRFLACVQALMLNMAGTEEWSLPVSEEVS